MERIRPRFESLLRLAVQEASRLARVRDAEIKAKRMAGATGTRGTIEGEPIGRWSYSAWDEAVWG